MIARRSLFILTVVLLIVLLGATGYAWTRDDVDDTSGQSTIEHGHDLFLSKGCAGCHHIADKGIVSGFGAGPDLSGLPETAELRADGQPPEAYVRASILNPRAYTVPGYSGGAQMPRLRIAPDELDALVAFLLDEM